MFGAYVLYVVLLYVVGFAVTLPITLFAISYLFSQGRNPSLKKSIIYGVLVATALYLLYVVLMGSQVPQGILWTLF